MRPQADVVEFVYECMSVTGEAMILIMISLDYFNAARIPGSAMLICMALVVLGNLGAQVVLVCLRFAHAIALGCSPSCCMTVARSRPRTDPAHRRARPREAYGALNCLSSWH